MKKYFFSKKVVLAFLFVFASGVIASASIYRLSFSGVLGPYSNGCETPYFVIQSGTLTVKFSPTYPVPDSGHVDIALYKFDGTQLVHYASDGFGGYVRDYPSKFVFKNLPFGIYMVRMDGRFSTPYEMGVYGTIIDGL